MYNQTLLNHMENSTNKINDEYMDVLINKIIFIIILCISIPSIMINLFATYRLHGNTKLSVFAFRCILHVSLFTTCTCIPLFLVELYFNLYFPLSLFICKLWLIIDYSSIVCLALLVCWASIQRHILIFGPIHMKKLQSTFKFKLIPSTFALGFPLIWYSILISTCTYEKTIRNKFRCQPCFEDKKFIFLIDTLLSLLFPLLITILATLFLLIRIIRLRFRLFRSNSKKWRRCKRLTRQMILFSSIYLIGLLPYVLVNLNSLYEFWPLINLSWCIQIANAFTYVPCCFSSFLSIYAIPEIWKNRRNHHHHQQQHQQQNSLRKNRKQEQTSFTLPSVFLTTKTSTDTE
ncbi:unnamed protein product [Adineta steineri]|uniref:G-protein coupled receptors family 1 profile domain-containing protein n=1 Tax=Adineta steineri TaxID=433720 RepID=A0A814N3A4_9BILA|nr:unnamed protein product [Adineta steineri]CAF3929502.1 unnamed protein product [Adineta steineri]